LALAMLVTIAGNLGNVWQVNVWSVAFARPALAYGLKNAASPEPPAIHRRAPIWMAQQALARGELQQAQLSVEALGVAANKDFLATRTLGQVLWAQDQTMEAIQTWLCARDYQALLDAARQAQEAGRLEDALSAYRAARVVDPQKGTLPLVNFLWWQYQGWDTAEALLRQALTQYPASPQRLSWLHRLGEMLRDEKRWDEAFAFYQQLLNEDPDDWQAYIGLGWVYYGKDGDFQRALDAFQKAILIAPERGEGYFAIGQLMVREQRYVEADMWFAQAIQRTPNIKWWWLARANATRSAGNFDDALKLYRQAIEQFPDWAAAYYEIAWAYRLISRTEEAVQSIETALSLVESPNAWYFVRAGEIYEWLGNMDVAIDFYRRALEIDPQNKTARHNLERLEK